jgi:putative Holliday junction resolvase
MKEGVKKVLEIVKEYEPKGIVIGYPLRESGEKSEKCSEIDEFTDMIAELYRGEIHKVDESWSSREAAEVIHAHGKKAGRDKARLDRLAAVIILQRFLNER